MGERDINMRIICARVRGRVMIAEGVAEVGVGAIAPDALQSSLPRSRTVFPGVATGAEVGQSVFQVRGHVLAGRSFSWPPG